MKFWVISHSSSPKRHHCSPDSWIKCTRGTRSPLWSPTFLMTYQGRTSQNSSHWSFSCFLKSLFPSSSQVSKPMAGLYYGSVSDLWGSAMTAKSLSVTVALKLTVGRCSKWYDSWEPKLWLIFFIWLSTYVCFKCIGVLTACMFVWGCPILNLQTVVGCHVVAGNWTWCSERAPHALTCWGIYLSSL